MGVLAWVAIVIGGLIALVVLSFVVVFVISLFHPMTPDGVEFDVVVPVLVGAEDEFELVVALRNMTDRQRVVTSVDFDHALLRGFAVQQAEPTAREVTSALGTTAYHYTLEVRPHDSAAMKFRCKALAPGEYSGDVIVYIDEANWKSLTKSTRLVVK